MQTISFHQQTKTTRTTSHIYTFSTHHPCLCHNLRNTLQASQPKQQTQPTQTILAVQLDQSNHFNNFTQKHCTQPTQTYSTQTTHQKTHPTLTLTQSSKPTQTANSIQAPTIDAVVLIAARARNSGGHVEGSFDHALPTRHLLLLAGRLWLALATGEKGWWSK